MEVEWRDSYSGADELDWLQGYREGKWLYESTFEYPCDGQAFRGGNRSRFLG